MTQWPRLEQRRTRSESSIFTNNFPYRNSECARNYSHFISKFSRMEQNKIILYAVCCLFLVNSVMCLSLSIDWSVFSESKEQTRAKEQTDSKENQKKETCLTDSRRKVSNTLNYARVTSASDLFSNFSNSIYRKSLYYVCNNSYNICIFTCPSLKYHLGF